MVRTLCTIAAMTFSAACPSRAAPIGPSSWQQDYAQLKLALEASYANLAWKGSPQSGADLPALNRATTAALAGARNDTEAARALRTFVAGFQDGHFSELPYLASGTAGSGAEPADPVLDPADPATGCAALGYASTGSVSFSLPFESLPGFTLVSDGLVRPFRAGMMHVAAGPDIAIVRIQNFRPKPFPAVCLAAWRALTKAGMPVSAQAIATAAAVQWFAALSAELRELEGKGARTLLIDIGNDSGGNDSGDWAARLFTRKPVASARLEMVDAPVSAGYFDEQIADLAEALAHPIDPAAGFSLKQARDMFVAAKAAIGKNPCDLSWVWHTQRPWRSKGCDRLIDAGFAGGARAGLPRGAYGDVKIASLLSSPSTVETYFATWTGPTYVLTDQRSYSAAKMFAAVMQDNGIARTIGTRTGGDGCGFMTDGTPLVLAHSHLRFRIPNCMRLRADGTNEEAGVTPDVPVLPTEGETARARAARLIRIVATSNP